MVEENPPTDTADEDNGPFPGWYPDPLGVAGERFWNGREWTGNARGEVTAAPAADAVDVSDPGSAAGPDSAIPRAASPGSAVSTEAATGTAETARTSKPRIFGTATDDKPTPASSTPQGERVKSALAQRAEAGSAAPILFDTPSFSGSADTRSVTAQAASAETTTPKTTPKEATPNEATSNGTTSNGTASNGKGAAAQSTAPSTPVPAPNRTEPVRPLADSSLVRQAPPANEPRRSWVAVMIAGLCALAIGLAAGWLARGSGGTTSDVTAAAPVTTSAEQADAQTTPEDTAEEVEAATDRGGDVSAVDGETLDEVQGQLDELSAELDQAQSDLDAITAERDNEQAHNDILQTWFTPEVRDRSERSWNAEVERACSVEAVPTLENTAYTRAMELMGTHADLVAAAAACQAGG